jgi:hypothetical protein
VALEVEAGVGGEAGGEGVEAGSGFLAGLARQSELEFGSALLSLGGLEAVGGGRKLREVRLFEAGKRLGGSAVALGDGRLLQGDSVRVETMTMLRGPSPAEKGRAESDMRWPVLASM